MCDDDEAIRRLAGLGLDGGGGVASGGRRRGISVEVIIIHYFRFGRLSNSPLKDIIVWP